MMRKYMSILACMFAILLLAACGNKEEAKETKDSKEEITLTDAIGEVTIPANPERIVATYSEDALLSLGIKPAVQWSISGAPFLYLQDKMKDIPMIEWDLPLEQVIEAEPDLIIFNSKGAIPEGKYEEYKKIAPVYVMEDDVSTDWRKQISVVGQILGKEKEAENVLEEYEKTAAEASKEIKNSIGDDSVAAIWVVGGQFYLMEQDRFGAKVLHEDLGITVPQMVKDLGSAEPTWNPVTLEALADLDADHVFLMASEGEAGIETLNNSAVWNATPAASKNQVYEIGYDGSWTVDGKIASEKVIADLKEHLVK